MVKIKGKTITLTKGDTLLVKVSIKDKDTNEDYIPSDGDEVRFALKSNYDDEQVLIYKEIPLDTLELLIPAEETKQLEVRTSPYVYDIQLTTATGYVDTFIDKGSLYITEEVE